MLSRFNGEYRKRRLAAAERGKRFMPYQDAKRRLHRALAEVAASGGTPIDLLAHVFEGKARRTRIKRAASLTVASPDIGTAAMGLLVEPIAIAA